MSGYALLFPGQGAQFPGMGRDLLAQFDAARRVFARADACLEFSVSGLCLDADETALQSTSAAQPAIAATSLAALAALEGGLGYPLAPAAVAGHSLGEYTAVIAAGAIDLDDGFRLIAERGRLMRSAAEARAGSMAAIIGLDSERCSQVCLEASDAGRCVVANDNAMQQQVISGDPEAVRRAGILAKEAGAKRVVPLAVAGAFHSEHMRPAEAALSAAISATRVDAARWPIVANVDTRWLTQPDDIRSELGSQLTSPVRWRSTLESMCRAGIELFVELGPGNVLAGLVRRNLPDARAVSVGDSAGIAKALEALGAVGRVA